MNNFCEQLVVEKNRTPYNLFKYGFYALVVITLLMLPIKLMFSIVFLVMAILFFFAKRKAFVEYEYIATNDQLDFDAIYEESRRKKICTVDIKTLDLLSRKNSNDFKDFSNKPKTVKKLFPKSYSGEVFCLICSVKGERIIIEFVPEDKIIQHCFKYNPRNVKR